MKPSRPLSLAYARAPKQRRWWRYVLPGIFIAVAAVGAFLLFVLVTEVFYVRWEPGIRARVFLRWLLGADP